MSVSNKPTITLREYISQLGNNGSFIIPDYQRGYIWGQSIRSSNKEMPKDSVSFLVESLLKGFATKSDLFLQGITVYENKTNEDEGAEISLVDGQQRTTFFFLLLKYLNFSGHISMRYLIRPESNKFLADDLNRFLAELKFNSSGSSEIEDESYQDIYFFKKTLLTFRGLLQGYNQEELLNYILDHIKFLYISIPKEKAKIIFSLMNGNKAIMKQEELIKSELLRCSSVNTEHIQDAENNSIRNRLAREWDKWLYWWNDSEVKAYFAIDQQLGWLLPLMTKSMNVSFDEFRMLLLNSTNEDVEKVKEAKTTFRAIKLLQQRIEDAYSNAIMYNYIGAILKIHDKEQRFKFLKWLFTDLWPDKKHEEVLLELKRYFDWAFIEVSHNDIINKNKEKYNEKVDDFLVRLDDDLLYLTKYETGAKWLLRCNILEDCSQNEHKGRKFDFTIWSQRSLEHIYPKSKVGHKSNNIPYNYEDNPLDEESLKKIKLWREDIYYKQNPEDAHEEPYKASEHSIGNLVLLYKDNNSTFRDKDFEDKKNLFFQITDSQGFKSRHLLHTVSVFAISKWTGAEIAKHKRNEIERFNKEYPKL